MEASIDRPRLLRRVAALCLLAMIATVALSAYLRLVQAGLGCADWPACYGQALAGGALPEAAPPAVAAARFAHRVVASAVLVGAFVIALGAISAPALRRIRAPALALVAFALALAALGAIARGSRLPAVAIGNLLGGFAMLALCWRLIVVARDDRPPALGVWASAAMIVLALQIALGAQVSVAHAALSCGDWTDCVRAAAHGDMQALNPLREPAWDATTLNRAAAPALLAHRLGALVAVVTVVALGVLAWRRGRPRAGALLIALAVLEPLLGWAIATQGLPLPLVLAHNAVAAAMLVVLAHLR